MKIFCGLDCGGSTTRVLAVDETGQTVFQGESGPANLVSTPPDKIREHLEEAIGTCPQVHAVCGCFAGLINLQTRALAETLLHEAFPAAHIRAEPDYAAAFFASPLDSDICVISGTGSLVCSYINGRFVKSGGRGYIVGDQGSGYQLGREALMWFLEDPAGAPEPMKKMVTDVFGSLDDEAIIAQIYQSQSPAQLIAQFAPFLVGTAMVGQQQAIIIIKIHVGALASIVARHAQKHLPDKQSLKVSLSGGLWSTGPVVIEVFANSLHERLPDRQIELVMPTRTPVQGALELALRM